MVKIVIIGSGQLGSRHLQALSLLDRPALIFVVDPNEDSLKLAEKRFLEISNAGNRIVDVKYCSSIDKIPNHIDLAIISTNSDIRRAIIENLLNCCRVNYLILEKVLFRIMEHRGEPFIISRKEEHGGDLTFNTIDEVREMYKKQELHPDDFKNGIISYIVNLLAPLKSAFDTKELKVLLSKSY